MEDVPDEQNVEVHKPQKSRPTKSMSKINNNRFLNQNIYNTFLQKRYGQCLALISKSQNLDEFKTYIKSLIQKNSYHLDKSLDLLNQCHIMNKLNYSYLKSISKNYFLLGKYKSSLQVAKDAHRINSNDYQIFYILAKISLALGDKDGAIAYFKTANGKQPNQESFIELAKIFMSNNEYGQAIDLLRECAQIAAQNPELYEMLGICNSKVGKLQQAFQAYRQALQIDAANYASLIGSGSIQLERGTIDEALETFKKAYKTSPNSAVLWNNIGIATFRKNKHVAAYCCFKRALFLQPFRWDIHSNLALLFIRKQKFLAAQVHLQSALKLNRDPVLFNLLGVCLIELKDYQNATMAFNEAIKMSPQYSQAIFNNMMCFYKQGQKAKAKVIWTDLQRRCNDDAVRDKVLSIKEKIME